MSRRGRMLLLEHDTMGLPPLGPPPDHLGVDGKQAWHDIVRASDLSAEAFRVTDKYGLAIAARELAIWREGDRDRALMIGLYRALGMSFVPMHERRRLLFPDRAPKRSRT
jgi:hypothetical protein